MSDKIVKAYTHIFQKAIFWNSLWVFNISVNCFLLACNISSLSRTQNNRLSLVLLNLYLMVDRPFKLCGPALIFQALITWIVHEHCQSCYLLCKLYMLIYTYFFSWLNASLPLKYILYSSWMTDLNNSWCILIIPVLFFMFRIHMNFCIYIFFKVLRRLFGYQCNRIVVIRVNKQFLYWWESLRHHRGRSVFFQS